MKNKRLNDGEKARCVAVGKISVVETEKKAIHIAQEARSRPVVETYLDAEFSSIC